MEDRFISILYLRLYENNRLIIKDCQKNQENLAVVFCFMPAYLIECLFRYNSLFEILISRSNPFYLDIH